MPKVTKSPLARGRFGAGPEDAEEPGLVPDEVVGGEHRDDGLGILEPDPGRGQHERRGRVPRRGLDEEALLRPTRQELAGLARPGGVGDEHHPAGRNERPDAPDRFEEHRVAPRDPQELLGPGFPSEGPEPGPPPAGQDDGPDVAFLHAAPSRLMTCWRRPRISFWISARAASVSASKRRTMTAWVFEARTSPQPAG